MTNSPSPFETHPPGAKRLAISVLAAVCGALVVLIAVVLPAEYNIDPTGVGRALGLTALNQEMRTLVIRDVIGGNETYREVEIPNPRDPVPLPNPAISQVKSAAPRAESVTLRLEPGQQTEVKAVLDEAQVILYSWNAEGGEVYTDFHGHEPDAGEAFVRYEEQQSGTRGHGSLVAPFSGEHGWFWLNISEAPVTIHLQLRGYHREVKDYGLF